MGFLNNTDCLRKWFIKEKIVCTCKQAHRNVTTWNTVVLMCRASEKLEVTRRFGVLLENCFKAILFFYN